MKSFLALLSSKVLPTLILILGMLLAVEAEAGNIHTCSQSGLRCVVRLHDGAVNDRVRVMDESALVIAEGKLIKRKGVWGIIELRSTNKTIRSGYPVTVDVENRNNRVHWTAATAASGNNRR